MATITVELGRDWGVEDISDEERSAYAAQVLAALEEEHPGADVEVTHGALVQRIDCDFDRDAEDDVRRTVQDVWDRGAFWRGAE